MWTDSIIILLHSFTNALTCGYVEREDFVISHFRLTVEGSGVKWGAMVESGVSTGPGEGLAANESCSTTRPFSNRAHLDMETGG